jgi:hypothetical protein
MVALTDTVYVEKPILIKDTVWKEREANYSVHKVTFGKQGTPQVSVETLSDRTETDFKTRQLNEAIDRIAVISTLGKERSSGRDRELLKLISVVY